MNRAIIVPIALFFRGHPSRLRRALAEVVLH
jgi:hypothetical protein